MENEYLLEMRQIKKSFTGVKALKGVDLKVRPGEIHALMGENGAGKSTLIKILTGIYSKDGGEIFFEGKEIAPSNSSEAQALGISTIYQEMNLIPHLSIGENIFLGREPKKLGFIDWKRIHEESRKLLKDKLNLEFDVDVPLNQCPTAVAQMAALARVISLNAKLLIMDEATSSLETAEVQKLFQNIRRLKEAGVAVIYITHKMDEIYQICDTVTVFKDGENVWTRSLKDTTKLELVSAMIGRDARDVLAFKKVYKDFSKEPVVCRAVHVEGGPKLSDVTLNVRHGEVVGLAGLLGSGRTEFSRAIFGADHMEGGELYIKEEKVRFRTPQSAVKKGMGFCSEDRKAEGILPNLSIKDNMMISIMPYASKRGIVDQKKMSELTDTFIEKLKIKTPDKMQLIQNLSGGNQQKVLLGRWLCMNPEFIILDEPTRGIDVGAKAEIEDLIQELSENGVGILYISTELEEMARRCDRIIVLKEGRNVREIVGSDISTDSIMEAMAGEAAHMVSEREG